MARHHAPTAVIAVPAVCPPYLPETVAWESSFAISTLLSAPESDQIPEAGRGPGNAVKRVRDRTETSELRTRRVIGELKTARFCRTLFLTPELVELLRDHRARLAGERIAIGPAWREHDLIFPSAIGTPLDPDNVSHWYSRICRRAGLGHWHLHELRAPGEIRTPNLLIRRRARRWFRGSFGCVSRLGVSCCVVLCRCHL